MVGGGIHLYVSKRRSRLAVADFNYAVWKDRINLTASLYDGKYWSVGLYFRVCLK